MHTNLNTIVLITAGIIFLGLVPPLGVFLLVAAFASQKVINHRSRRARSIARARAAEREERELILAYKSLG